MPWSFWGARQTNVEFLAVAPVAEDHAETHGSQRRHASQKNPRRKAANNYAAPEEEEGDVEVSNPSAVSQPSQHRSNGIAEQPSPPRPLESEEPWNLGDPSLTPHQSNSEDHSGADAVGALRPINTSSLHQELAPGFLPDESLDVLLDDDEQHAVKFRKQVSYDGTDEESDGSSGTNGSSRKRGGDESVCTRIAVNGRNSILFNRFRELRKLTHELSAINTSEEKGVLRRLLGKVATFFDRSRSLRSCCSSLIDPQFILTTPANLICSMVIVVNAVYIGIELSLNPDTGFKLGWFLCETIFMTFFILELLLRLRALGLRYSVRDSWMIFDAALIVPSIFDVWILQFYLANSDSGMPKLTLLRLLRLARVARVLRIIRLIRYFRELILLTWGILGAVQALSWSVALLIMILYVSAVLTTNWYNYMDRAEDKILLTETGHRFHEWFGSLGSSLLTLFQIVTLEGWDDILRTCMEISGYSVLLFIPYLILTRYMLLNAITAVVVEKVFSIAQHETSIEAKRSERQRLKALQKLKSLFISIDLDHNASLDLREFQAALQDTHVAQQFMDLGITNYEADDLFECLDLDGNQELTVTEFIDGCLRAVGVAQNKHLLQVQYDLHRNSVVLEARFAKLQAGVLQVLKLLSRINKLSTRSMANLAPSKRRNAGRKSRKQAGERPEHQHHGAHRSPRHSSRQPLPMQTIQSGSSFASSMHGVNTTSARVRHSEQSVNIDILPRVFTAPAIAKTEAFSSEDSRHRRHSEMPWKSEQARHRERERPTSARKRKLSGLLHPLAQHPLAQSEPSSPFISQSQSLSRRLETSRQLRRSQDAPVVEKTASLPSIPLFSHPLDIAAPSCPPPSSKEKMVVANFEANVGRDDQSDTSNTSRQQEQEKRVLSHDSLMSGFSTASSNPSARIPAYYSSRRDSRALTESLTLRGSRMPSPTSSRVGARSAGKLLEAASRDQKDISNVMQGLLTELRSFRGSVAEASASQHQQARRTT